MTMQFLQILGLLVVVFGFAGVVLWTYSPRNKERFAAGSRLPLDNAKNEPAPDTKTRDQQ